MNRTIKFRAWDVDTMLQIELADLQQKGFTVRVGDCYVKGTLMQFTGLLDKNGREIYEGDVVELSAGIRKTVEFHKGVFCYKRGEKEWHIFNEKEVEIIGNIYEDANLLGDAD